MFGFVFKINLFDAGTVVNATGSYVNAYTGTTTAFSGKNDLSVEMKDFYDTQLLENARITAFYEQFGMRQQLPAGHKGTAEWRKFNTFANADKLQEGVIPTGQKMGVSRITGSINQYGTFTAVSDVLEMRAYDPIISQASLEMGASAAETYERLIRDALYSGTNVMYCDNFTLASGASYNTPTSNGGLLSNSTYLSKITPTMVNKVASKMRRDKVPGVDGVNYVAVIHPDVKFDLMEDENWKDFHKYSATTEIFNGEIGMLHGVRFIENPFAPCWKGADLASDTRTLTVNAQSGYSGAITSIAFDGSSAGVAADELIGRYIMINGVKALVTDNTATTITFASTNFGSVADNALIYPGEGGGEGCAIYATYFFGKEPFGIIDPEGGNLQMIVKGKDQVGGPLEQFSTIGYKFETNGATILYPERIVRVMSSSSLSGNAENNT